ncbi:hypothetical protein [Haloplanus sp. C73]|uniref:hypothetical protein n=1 Tax=Haloplanus sp. C73 TaxID=3421641 RepID=UPI003EB80D5E
MSELPARYLVGSGCGLTAFILTTLLLGVPSSFAVFVARTFAIVLVASMLGFCVFDSYDSTESG